MASEFIIDLPDQVVPENKGGPRVGLGAKAFVTRVAIDGSVAIQLLRGDGGGPEAYTYNVRTKILGPFAAGVRTEITIGSMDLPMPDFAPRRYRLRLVGLGGADISVDSPVLVTAPYSPAAVA